MPANKPPAPHRPVAGLKSGAADISAELATRLEALGARHRKVRLERIELQLCEPRTRAFRRTGWIFELKYDGFRVLAGPGRLRFRRGTEAMACFPELDADLAGLPPGTILDAELVSLDDSGRPVFQRLLKRSMLNRMADIQRAAVDYPAALF